MDGSFSNDGTFNQIDPTTTKTVTFAIVGFDLFENVNNAANPSHNIAVLPIDEYQVWTRCSCKAMAVTTSGVFHDGLRKWLSNNVATCFPDFHQYITKTKHKSFGGSASSLVATEDLVFIPSSGNFGYTNSSVQEEPKFPYFSSNSLILDWFEDIGVGSEGVYTRSLISDKIVNPRVQSYYQSFQFNMASSSDCAGTVFCACIG